VRRASRRWSAERRGRTAEVIPRRDRTPLVAILASASLLFEIAAIEEGCVNSNKEHV